MIEIGLDLLLHILAVVVARRIMPSVLTFVPVVPLGQLLQLIPLVQAMDILERLTQRSRHLLVQVLMMPLLLSCPVGNELVRACLFDVIVKPWQIEFIHAEADEVQE